MVGSMGMVINLSTAVLKGAAGMREHLTERGEREETKQTALGRKHAILYHLVREVSSFMHAKQEF